MEEYKKNKKKTRQIKMKKYKKRLEVGETLEVFIKKVDTSTGKIYLTMNDERITTEI